MVSSYEKNKTKHYLLSLSGLPLKSNAFVIFANTKILIINVNMISILITCLHKDPIFSVFSHLQFSVFGSLGTEGQGLKAALAPHQLYLQPHTVPT